ncbi:hypothetical protein EN871_33290, partial [bacterium M00.F.Ca.ET.228.01.1.1]
TNRTGVPRNAMMFHTITNLSVARDEETQGLRRKMIRLLLIVVGGFVVLAVGIGLVDRTP